MESKEEKELVPVLVRQKEQEEKEALPLEALDMTFDELRKIRELPRRWRVW